MMLTSLTRIRRVHGPGSPVARSVDLRWLVEMTVDDDVACDVGQRALQVPAGPVQPVEGGLGAQVAGRRSMPTASPISRWTSVARRWATGSSSTSSLCIAREQ